MTLRELHVLLIDTLIKMLMQNLEERLAGHIPPILLRFPNRHQSESSCAEFHKYYNGKRIRGFGLLLLKWN